MTHGAFVFLHPHKLYRTRWEKIFRKEFIPETGDAKKRTADFEGDKFEKKEKRKGGGHASTNPTRLESHDACQRCIYTEGTWM